MTMKVTVNLIIMTTTIVIMVIIFKTCNLSVTNFLIATVITQSSRIQHLATSLISQTKHRIRNQVEKKNPGEAEIGHMTKALRLSVRLYPYFKHHLIAWLICQSLIRLKAS